MKIALRYRGEEHELDVPEGMTIAAAAKLEGMQLFGSCNGNNLCAQCSCEVREGIDSLVKRNGEPYEHRDGYAPFVKTCQVSPTDDGVSINADNRARRW